MKMLSHRFVDEMPSPLENGILYISLEFNTVMHLCACGCGAETVTPLGRTDWRMTYNGDAVSLSPSVGNWSLPCRSHYVIDEGRVLWAEAWSDEQVEAGRLADRRLKHRLFGESAPLQGVQAGAEAADPESVAVEGLWHRFSRWIRSFF